MKLRSVTNEAINITRILKQIASKFNGRKVSSSRVEIPISDRAYILVQYDRNDNGVIASYIKGKKKPVTISHPLRLDLSDVEKEIKQFKHNLPFYEATHPAATTSDEHEEEMYAKAASEKKKKEARAKMSLQEIMDDGSIDTLALQYYHAVQNDDLEEIRQLKGLIAARLLGDGWDRPTTTQFLDSLEAMNSPSDVYKLLSRHNMVSEGSPTDKANLFKAIITIPMIAAANVKAEVKDLENTMKRKYFKIIKAKAEVIAGFESGGDDSTTEKVVNIEVYATFWAKFERDQIYSMLEPNYKVTELTELDPKTKEPLTNR